MPNTIGAVATSVYKNGLSNIRYWCSVVMQLPVGLQTLTYLCPMTILVVDWTA
jgi:hypothetical protein